MKHKPFDSLGLASRLRRVSQAMLGDGDNAYAAEGIDFRTRLFPVIYPLHRDGELTVGELTAISGFTQPAISQTVRQLAKEGYVEISAGRDARERKVALTQKGNALVDSLLPFWTRVRHVMQDLLAEVQPDFLAALDSLEAALDRRSLFERIATTQGTDAVPVVDLVPFSVEYKQAFHDLNLDWVQKYFRPEPYDLEQLQHPERILEKGGEIWFALLDGAAVGTGALYCKGEGEFEIAKMAVKTDLRGHGIGAKLMEKLIQRFVERGGKRLFLATNSMLKPAIALYRRFGFVDFVPDEPPEYERADTFMEWRRDAS